jgi:hypothetical protein
VKKIADWEWMNPQRTSNSAGKNFEDIVGFGIRIAL